MLQIFGRDYPKIVTPLIKNAKRSIDICMYAWMWYPDQIGSEIQKFNTAIIYAAKRGVNVTALTRTAKTVKILKTNGVNAKEWAGGNLLHNKIILVDDKYLVCGSHNLTQNGFSLNLETSSLLESESGFPEVKKYLKELWSL